MDALFLLLLIVGWILGTILVSFVADQKGRSTLSWSAIALALSPLIALIALAALPARPRGR